MPTFLKAFFVLAFALAFVSCTSGGGAATSPAQGENAQGGNVQVQSYEDLGLCDFGQRWGGERKYVINEDRTYQCLHGKWWLVTEDRSECSEETVGTIKSSGDYYCDRCCGQPYEFGCTSWDYNNKYLWVSTTLSGSNYEECYYTDYYGLLTSSSAYTSLSNSSVNTRPLSSSVYSRPFSSSAQSSSSKALQSSSSKVSSSSSGGWFVGTMTDSRDGQTYKTMNIDWLTGTKTWMAQNLNYVTADSYCYDDNPSNCTKYGRLYTWDAATTACPKGWRLPSKEEWGTFESVDGSLLKSNTGWVRGYAGVDMYDFSVLPAGCRYDDGDFADEGYDAYFWSSTEFAGRFAYGLTLDSDFDAVSLFDYSMDSGFSVRCLKD